MKPLPFLTWATALQALQRTSCPRSLAFAFSPPASSMSRLSPMSPLFPLSPPSPPLTPPSPMMSPFSPKTSTISVAMVPAGFEDLSHLHDHLSHLHHSSIIHLTTTTYPDHHAHAVDVDHLVAQTSNWIADNAASTAVSSDGAAVPDEENSWWESYIRIYRNGLAFVHDDIVDKPLRKIGWDQTWGVSIFLFTAAVRSLLIPFSIQQSKSSEYMKALKPYTQKIKEKYADKNMQNRAIAKLYEDAEQNPLAGCITSFAQIPIFLGLYRSVTRLAKEDRLDEPFLWIPSLEGPVTAETNYRGMEWLTEGWVDGVPPLGWETTLSFLVMPVILVLMQSLTMSVLQQPEDESASEEDKEQMKTTKTVLKFLPLMIGFFSLQVPAGLTIYWFTSNLFTVSQSLIIRGYYAANPPEIKLPDYWGALDKGAEMTADEKREAAMAGLATGPSFDELLDEAKFHYVVKRDPLREESDAWARVKVGSSKTTIPDEMKTWVEAGTKVEAAEPVSS